MPIRRMSIEEYYKEYKKLRKGVYVAKTIHIPQKTVEKLNQISEISGIPVLRLISSIITQFALTYSYDELVVPHLEVIVNEDEDREAVNKGE